MNLEELIAHDARTSLLDLDDTAEEVILLNPELGVTAMVGLRGSFQVFDEGDRTDQRGEIWFCYGDRTEVTYGRQIEIRKTFDRAGGIYKITAVGEPADGLIPAEIVRTAVRSRNPIDQDPQ